MPRRWPACLAALFAVFALTAQGLCKPPDLPSYQNITVTPQVGFEDADPALVEALGFLSQYPIQVLDLDDMPEGPCGEEIRSECPAPAPECPCAKLSGVLSLCGFRGTAVLMAAQEALGYGVYLAMQQAEARKLQEEWVRHFLDFEEPSEAQEEPKGCCATGGCCVSGCCGMCCPSAMCPVSQVLDYLSHEDVQIEIKINIKAAKKQIKHRKRRHAATAAAVRKPLPCGGMVGGIVFTCDTNGVQCIGVDCDADAGKTEMVTGLLKACRLAVGDGRMEKAADLARQAHAVDPARVEADPTVIKLDLLNQYQPVKTQTPPLVPGTSAGTPRPAGSSEEAEPGANGIITLVPRMPVIEVDVEALDFFLIESGKPGK